MTSVMTLKKSFCEDPASLPLLLASHYQLIVHVHVRCVYRHAGGYCINLLVMLIIYRRLTYMYVMHTVSHKICQFTALCFRYLYLAGSKQ